MSPDVAIRLLCRDIPQAKLSQVYPLYERSHRWPVVLGILNGILHSRLDRSSELLLSELVTDLVVRLDRLGLTGADDLADQETRTARDVLAVGIDELTVNRNGARLRDRYLSLAAFPADQLVPFSTLARLWDCDRIEAQATCDQFADRSLLGSVESGGVRLHDIVRDHLCRNYRNEI